VKHRCIRRYKRLPCMSLAQLKLWRRLEIANGKTIEVTPRELRTARSMVKRKSAVATKTGFKLHPRHIFRPQWSVEASWPGLDWGLRNKITKSVPGSSGSGFDFVMNRYDVTWGASTPERAAKIAARVRKATPRKVRVRVLEPWYPRWHPKYKPPKPLTKAERRAMRRFRRSRRR
jgi:hypothetical protein